MGRNEFLAQASAVRVTQWREWFLRPLDIANKSRIEAVASHAEKTAADCEQIRWIALSSCLCDEIGERLLTSDDRKAFSEWDSELVESCFEEVLRISGITGSDKQEFQKN